MRLTECKLTFEGPGITRSDTRDLPNVETGDTMRITITLKSKFAGEHSLVACFHSKEFAEIIGSTKIVVKK